MNNLKNIKVNKKWLLPLILALMTTLASALLMGSDALTAKPIAEQKQQALLRSLSLLIPDELHDNDLINDRLSLRVVELGHKKSMDIYLGYRKGQLSVAAIPVIAPNGYSGDIEIMVGVQANGELTAVEVLAHKETPGLGDLVERRKGDWLLQFNGASLEQPAGDGWQVKKDGGEFDQITGATITPRAIVQAVHKALNYFGMHNKRWQDQQWRVRRHASNSKDVED